MVSIASAQRGLVLTGLIYYWAYLYLRLFLPPPEQSPFAYLVTVVPIALLASLGTVLNLAADRRRRFQIVPICWLIGFAATAVLASMLRGDIPTILSAGLLVLTLVWLTTAPEAIRLTTINRVFVLSVLAAAVFYALGWSEYGLLPGQYSAGEDRGITWRVSLFPFVPESGFFAAIVLLANQILGRGMPRVAYCLAALYFLAFSGVRSALLGWLLCLAFVALDQRTNGTNGATRHPRVGRRLALIAGLLMVFVAIVLSSTALQFFPELVQGAFGNYLFHHTTPTSYNADSISQSVYRGWLWLQHIEIFLSSPLTGVGSYEFLSLVSEPLILGHMGTGSESFFTQWLSRVGLCVVPFFFFLAVVAARAAKRPSPQACLVFILLGVSGLAYGSFLVPYNFMFILIFGLILPAPESSRAVAQLSQPKGTSGVEGT